MGRLSWQGTFIAGRVRDATALSELLENSHLTCSTPREMAPIRRLDRSHSYPIHHLGQPPLLDGCPLERDSVATSISSSQF
jgi:hypothetical protein